MNLKDLFLLPNLITIGRLFFSIYLFTQHLISDFSISILVLIKNSEDFSYLIKNPTTRSEDLIKVTEMISEKNNHNELLKRFISFIIKKRRFFYVEKILNDFQYIL